MKGSASAPAADPAPARAGSAAAVAAPRVLHVVSTMGRGGIATAVRALLPALEAAGVDASLLSLDTDLGARGPYDPAALARLLVALVRTDADAVHLHGFPALPVGALAALVRRGVRFVYTEHNVTNRRRRPDLRWLDRLLYEPYDVVACVSRAVARELVAQHPGLLERVVVVPNIVRPLRASAPRDALRTRYAAELGIDPSLPWILSAVAHDRRKRLGLMLDAVGELLTAPVDPPGAQARPAVHAPPSFSGNGGPARSSGPVPSPGVPEIGEARQPILLLAGDGPLTAELQAVVARCGAAARVRFLGRRGDIVDLMAASDLLLHASAVEGFPMLLAEAVAVGCPIAAFDTGPMPELVGPSSGVLVAELDGHALARAALALLRATGRIDGPRPATALPGAAPDRRTTAPPTALPGAAPDRRTAAPATAQPGAAPDRRTAAPATARYSAAAAAERCASLYGVAPASTLAPAVETFLDRFALASGRPALPRDWIADDLRVRRLLPAAAACLDRAEFASEEAWAAVRSMLGASALIATAQAQKTAPVLAALDDLGIDHVLLKGASVASFLYDEPALRPTTDLDVLVDPARALDVVERLRELGYRPEGVAPFSGGRTKVTLSGRAPSVDLHVHIFSHARLAAASPLDAPTILARAVVRGGRPALAPFDLLLHLALHGTLFTPPLFWPSLLDLDQLVRREPLDWDDVGRRAREARLATALHGGLVAARALFGTPLPDDVLRGLRPSTLRAALTHRWSHPFALLQRTKTPTVLAVAAEAASIDGVRGLADYLRAGLSRSGAP